MCALMMAGGLIVWAAGYDALPLTIGGLGGGFGLLLFLVGYQFGEYAKYHDTIALDLKDLTIGYGVGLAIAVAAMIAVRLTA